MTVLRWCWKVVRAIFTWEVCGTICCYLLVTLLVALFVDNTTARYAAQNSLGTARSLSTARITSLNNQITSLSHQLEQNAAKGAKQRGELLAKIAALSSQLAQLGVTPVVTVRQPAATVTAQPSATTTPRPSSSPTHAPTRKPTPTPSRSCLLKNPTICTIL